MLEQSLITHCAPTLAGLKTAGLFCFSYTSESMLQGRAAALPPGPGEQRGPDSRAAAAPGAGAAVRLPPGKAAAGLPKARRRPLPAADGYALQPEIALGS